MRDHDLNDIEAQLRRSADHWFRQYGQPAPVDALLTEHDRRRRRRLAIVGVGAAAPLLAVILLGVGRLTRSPEMTPEINRRSEKIAVSKNGADKQGVVAATHETARDGAMRQPGGLSSVESTGVLDHGDRTPIFVPILLSPAEKDGEPVVTTGIYLPGHVETVNLQDLSPPEQAAVLRVLGLDEHARSRVSL